MNSRLFQTVIITLAAMTTVASTDIFVPSLPDMARYFGATAEQVQLSIPFAMVGALVGSPLMGSLSDHYGRKPVLLAGILLFFIASVGCMCASSIEMFLAFRFFQGIGATSSFVIGWAIVQELYPKDESARVMSWLGSIIATAPLIAPMLGGYIHVLFGWRANFALIAGMTALLAILIILSKPQTLTKATGKALSPLALLRNYKVIAKDKAFLLYLSFFFLQSCGQWAYITLVPFYFESVLNLTPDVFGVYLSAGVLFYIAGTFLTPVILRYLDPMQTIFLGILFSLSGGLGLLTVSLVIPTSPALITLCIGVYMLGTGTAWGPSTSRALQKFTDMRGAASAVRGLLVTTFFAIGSLVGSFLDDSLPLLAIFLIAMGVLCWINFNWLKRLDGTTDKA